MIPWWLQRYQARYKIILNVLYFGKSRNDGKNPINFICLADFINGVQLRAE